MIGGFSDGTFRPGDPVTRGQMATMFARAFELPERSTAPFSDVADSTHEVGINAIAAAGITSGLSDGTFRPGENTTREQGASFLYRAL